MVDSLGVCTVVEGCRQLTKVAFTQLDMADSVFERMARQTTQLQVRLKVSNFDDYMSVRQLGTWLLASVFERMARQTTHLQV